MGRTIAASLLILLLFVCLVCAQATGGGSTGHQTILVNDGDSLSTTFSSPDGMTFPALAVADIGYPPLTAYNTAVNGETLATMVSNFSTNITPKYNSQVPFLVYLLAGTNDIRGGANASTIFGNLQTYVNNVHALGPVAKIIIGVNLFQCDIFGNSTWKTALQTLNNNIVANWNVAQGSGGLGADGISNMWADPTIGVSSGVASSAFCNATYSPDGQHGTDLSRGIMGQIMANSVLPLLH